MVRTGAASPELIKLIMEYFNELDTDKSGGLTMEEIQARVNEVDSDMCQNMLHNIKTMKRSLSSGMQDATNKMKDTTKAVVHTAKKKVRNSKFNTDKKGIEMSGVALTV